MSHKATRWAFLFFAFLCMNQALGQVKTEVTDAYDHYKNRSALFPLHINPTKWTNQTAVSTWDEMERAVGAAFRNQDGYGLYQLAYQEYVHQFTKSSMDPRTMLYNAFEMGLKKGDPYLMYWVTELENTVYFRFEYLERRRNHARLTDSVAFFHKEAPILYKLADLNDKAFKEMHYLAATYLQCADLKNETFGLIEKDPRIKAKELESAAFSKLR